MTNEEKSQALMYCVLKEHTWDVRKQITECAIYMAEWKDEQHAKEKQQWIEKACEWLKDMACYYAHWECNSDTCENEIVYDTEKLIEDFKKTMENTNGDL